MRKPPVVQVEIISGDQFPDLETAQEAALPDIADSLQAVIQDLIDRGILINTDGKIIPQREQVTP